MHQHRVQEREYENNLVHHREWSNHFSSTQSRSLHQGGGIRGLHARRNIQNRAIISCCLAVEYIHSQLEFKSQADDPAMWAITPHLQLHTIRCVKDLAVFLPDSQLASFNGVADIFTDKGRYGIDRCTSHSDKSVILCMGVSISLQ